MSDYLADLHQYKGVFLRVRATKAAKGVAREATKNPQCRQAPPANAER